MAKKAKKKKISSKLGRPPVVTIMGHVDHGKTTLLDKIRESEIVETEHGGITQHIGAYQISHKEQKITFIDTPGHAAFTQMRARGAQVTDIVILVVAANDGVKPQTVESIKHIQSAGVPLIVAVNKIDLPQASSEMAKAQLTEHEIFVEGYGGQTPVLEISAITGKGIDELLEMIVLVAELEGLEDEKNEPLEAIVIESKVDKQRGSMATLIVKKGVVKHAEYIFDGMMRTKIRMMFNDLGESIVKVGPGDPVQILGFKKTPEVGALFTAEPREEVAEVEVVGEKEKEVVKEEVAAESEEMEEVEVEKSFDESKRMKLIVKADMEGTLEAILSSIMQDEVELIDSGVGNVSESDVMLAQTTEAEIIGFNVNVSTAAKKLAGIEGVDIKIFNIIYKLIEYIEEVVLTLIEPTINEEEVGEAKIEAIFEIRGEKIAGCTVKSGKIEKSNLVHVMRKENLVGNAKLKTLKQGKDDIKTAKAGKECGLVLSEEIDFRVGDVIKSYRIVKD